MKPLTLEEIRQRAADGCGTTPLEREFLLAEVDRLKDDADSAWEIANTTQMQRDAARAEVDKLKDWLRWATEFTVLDNRIQEVYPGCWVVCLDVPYPKGRVYLTTDGVWVAHQPMVGEVDIVFASRDAAEVALNKKMVAELAEPRDWDKPHGPRSK